MVPNDDLTTLRNYLQTTQILNYQCIVANRRVECPCNYLTNLDDAFPELSIEIGSPSQKVTLKMKGSAYMKFDTANTCFSLFQSAADFDNKNYWKLGLPTYRAYEIVHDMDNSKMGFKAQGSNAQVL